MPSLMFLPLIYYRLTLLYFTWVGCLLKIKHKNKYGMFYNGKRTNLLHQIMILGAKRFIALTRKVLGRVLPKIEVLRLCGFPQAVTFTLP